MWVWQNREGWTDAPSDSLTIAGVPAASERIEVHGWNGLLKTVSLKGDETVTVAGLAPGQTYMLLATRGSDESPGPPQRTGVLP